MGCVSKASDELLGMLNMLDKQHSILLYGNIALMGNIDYEVEDWYEVEDIPSWNNETTKRGEYFDVLDSDGCLMFDMQVYKVGVLFNNMDIVGYVFVLKDYRAIDNKNSFFTGLEETKPGIIISYNNKLYINEIIELLNDNRFEFDRNMEFEEMNSGDSKLFFKGINYISCCIDDKNNIYRYRPLELKL